MRGTDLVSLVLSVMTTSIHCIHSAATVVSMICVSHRIMPSCLVVSSTNGQWLTMPDNLIFMGLHFIISKCESLEHLFPFISCLMTFNQSMPTLYLQRASIAHPLVTFLTSPL